MNLILVDDEPAILDLLAAACEADGHVVKTFSSSSDALNYLRTHHTDLLITDIVMPPPDGFRLVSAARKAHRKLVAILVTGHVSRYSIEDVLACGGSDLLFKPLHLDELRLGVPSRRRASEGGQGRGRIDDNPRGGRLRRPECRRCPVRVAHRPDQQDQLALTVERPRVRPTVAIRI